MIPRWRLGVLAGAAALALAACGDKPVEKKSGPPPTLITVTRAQAMPLEIVERTLGSLEAVIDPKVAAEVPGRVIRLAVRAGQKVRKGQLLAELDTVDAAGQERADRAEIARIESLLAQQERVVARQNELVARNFISRNAADDATALRDALRSQLAMARARAGISGHALQRTRITSPVDGTIEVQIASVGDYLKVGDPLVRLVSNTRLRANLPFPEAVAERLKPGQTVRLVSPLRPGRVIEASIHDIRPTLIETSRAVEAIARFDNLADGGELRGGSSVDATVVIGRKEKAVMLPEQSVVLRPAGKVVYVIDNDKARQRIVTTGAKQAGLIEIVEGIAAGETVALDGAGFLTDGGTVSVHRRDAAAPATAKAPQDKPSAGNAGKP
ncbi:MAG: efflux RND transporter periplasmic adaptor subunit [Rhodocyclales bacterium]|nr:efflux RND transporter periplasmic adaptor subunit [Rhodocyclales bacterium]